MFFPSSCPSCDLYKIENIKLRHRLKRVGRKYARLYEELNYYRAERDYYRDLHLEREGGDA